jgi:hypothetical protein
MVETNIKRGTPNRSALNRISNIPGYEQETLKNWRFRNTYTIKRHFDIIDNNLTINFYDIYHEHTHFLLEFKYLSGFKVIQFVVLPDDINKYINSYLRTYLHVTFSIQYKHIYRAPVCELQLIEHNISSSYINIVDYYTNLLNVYNSAKRPMFVRTVFIPKKTLEKTVLDLILMMDRNHFKFLLHE